MMITNLITFSLLFCWKHFYNWHLSKPTLEIRLLFFFYLLKTRVLCKKSETRKKENVLQASLMNVVDIAGQSVLQERAIYTRSVATVFVDILE